MATDHAMQIYNCLHYLPHSIMICCYRLASPLSICTVQMRAMTHAQKIRNSHKRPIGNRLENFGVCQLISML